MATGDQNDMQQRLAGSLPVGWFPSVAPVRDALLAGFASMWASVYALIAYTRLQTRIATATDCFLDMVSVDFFGTGLPRYAGETDTAYRARIIAALFRPRNTRQSVIDAATAACGSRASVIEPNRIADTGAWNSKSSAWGVAGCWGSYAMPGQFFVTAPRIGYATASQVYAAINGVRPANTIAWTDT